MRSVRTRITVIATAVTAIALVLASVFVVRGLRNSLTDQLDDGIADQVLDSYANFFTTDDLLLSNILNDPATLQVFVDRRSGLWLANDAGVDEAEVLDELDLEASLLTDVPVLTTGSIETATDTTGSENMRIGFYPLELEDLPEESSTIYAVVGRSLDPVDAAVASTRNRLAIVVPTLVALVAALAWWLTGRALLPVERMRAEVDEITVGDLSRRLSEPGSADEVHRLAATMNSMLGRMEAATGRERRFVSDAAHELRTPLAAMAAQLDVDRTHPDTADPAATTAVLRREVDRMQGLVEDLLALARRDQGEVELELTLIDLDEIARSATDRITLPDGIELDRRGLSPVEARGDQHGLRRLIDNLVINATRHAASGVSVATGTDSDGVWLTVDDDGHGVPAEDRERIFERFVRLDEARSRDRGGSGLGLALAREIAVEHGGSLFVMDSPLGGARFVLRLPAAR